MSMDLKTWVDREFLHKKINNKVSMIDIFGGTSKPVGVKAVAEIWKRNPNRFGDYTAENKWSNSWMEVVMAASQYLKEEGIE